ncbi:MAG: N-acetylmuramidase family protein [Muribaculaceae bacterium]|nr:N-acetylmuramidase family protein [Muribaculaceae bacterium]
MRRRLMWAMLAVLAGIAYVSTAGACADKDQNAAPLTAPADTIPADSLVKDSIAAAKADSVDRYRRLTDEDFQLVADELGVEVAAMKAVVSIEAGAAMKGFVAPGVPIINFDPSMFRIYGPKAPSKAGNKNAKVPPGLSGYALKEWTQLTNARHKNAKGADMATFWGMFQIGGFNYKTCGCASVDEFVEKMSYSELAQLELFAKFLVGTGQVKYLRDKNWAKFARAYNGASYARRGYHTRMAAAYKKFSKKN